MKRYESSEKSQYPRIWATPVNNRLNNCLSLLQVASIWHDNHIRHITNDPRHLAGVKSRHFTLAIRQSIR